MAALHGGAEEADAPAPRQLDGPRVDNPSARLLLLEARPPRPLSAPLGPQGPGRRRLPRPCPHLLRPPLGGGGAAPPPGSSPAAQDLGRLRLADGRATERAAVRAEPRPRLRGPPGQGLARWHGLSLLGVTPAQPGAETPPVETVAAGAEADAAGGSARRRVRLGRQEFQAHRAGAEGEVGSAQEVLELVAEHEQLGRAVAGQLLRQVPEGPPHARRALLPEGAQGGLQPGHRGDVWVPRGQQQRQRRLHKRRAGLPPRARRPPRRPRAQRPHPHLRRGGGGAGPADTPTSAP